MKTILYNIETQQIIGHFDPCYLVNGKPGLVELPAVELPVINTEPPTCGPDEIAISRFEVTEESYLQVWSFVPKPIVVPEFDTQEITRLLLKKLDNEPLTQQEEDLLTAYKAANA